MREEAKQSPPEAVGWAEDAGWSQRFVQCRARCRIPKVYITRCDFNNNSRPFCDWTQPCKVNQGAWIRTKHATPTSGTGPDGDYPDGNGYFIYQEASNLIPFDTDRIESPEIVVSGEICIDFWYHMFGSEDLNELKVIVQNEGVEALKWSQKGNRGSSWIYGFTTVPFLTETRIKVIFEAVRGLTEYGDTAVDNVGVRNGPCVMVPSTTPPASSTATTESALPVITEATCSVHSDPHYYTFDKQSHTFMGNCTYTLSKLCDGNSTLPYFNVEAANEHRGGNTRVSYVQYVDVDVYDYRITLGKNRVVKVNGAIQVLPVVLASGVNISFSGQYVMVTTAFGLRVKFNGDHRAEVILPSIYKSKVCGMCGNYNEHKADDFLNPDGEMEANSVSLGNSWQIYNDSSCVPDLGHTPNCSDDEKHMIQSNKYCGLITDPSGPFRQCHSVADPLVYFEDCLYDLCELHLNNAALCNNLQSYADVCQAAGILVGTWRNETFCPLICPANSHYEACTAACPATCVNPMAPASCSLPCVEGCVCDSGYLLYNGGCVPSSQCGCWHNGKHYPVGAEFWTDDTCSSKCTCPSRGSKVTCSNAACPADHYCGVQNGEPGCYRETYGICRVHNDPHYNTFDRETHHFMGKCTYTLAKVCANSSSLPSFNVEAKNEHRGNPTVSYVQKVLVEVYGEHIEIVKATPNRVLINKIWSTLPVTTAGGSITVSRSGRYVTLETDFRLRVSYDTDHSVEVKVPTTYFNRTCGMCGNFNNRREDDYMMPDGQQAKNSNELGNSWRVKDDDPSCDVIVPPKLCPADQENLYRTNRFCGMITKRPGPFGVCHSVINPESFFESCVYDLCVLNGNEQLLCNALETYADACQEAGVTLTQWRNATFCPLPCPSNSHYNPCTSACPATCSNPVAASNCSKPCVEGCECNSGFVLSGGQCVSMGNCGCLYKDKYYERGETFWETNCESQCNCAGNNAIVCSSKTCAASQICKVQNGILGCYPLDINSCHIYGDPHYITFDGRLYHFQGGCNYTIVETCTNSSEQFSVTTRNEHRGSQAWTALNSVAVTLKNIHIALRKNKEVYVNGIQVDLPVTLHPGITVAVRGPYVVIDTSIGIQVKFDGDQQLFVHADERFKGLLCGLCGTYTDNQLDDFLRPDRVLEQDSNNFGNSWRVKDDNWTCDPVAVIPPACNPVHEYEYEELCKVILASGGPFEACHWYIPPQLYFESCVYDQCATAGNTEQFCSSLDAYAAACEGRGVSLGDWRKETLCAPTCSAPNSHYEPCMTACPATCLDRLAPENCSKPCVEGCACNSGFVLSGGACVPEAKCGCVFQDRYYSEGESVVTENCTSRCECLGNGNMTCSELSCGPDEICKIQTGLRGCYPAGTATCHIYGDPHYTTFDGKLHHFQGACNYSVVETCDNASGSFRVTTRNEHRGSPSWTAINSVALTLDGVHIALGKNRTVYLQFNYRPTCNVRSLGAAGSRGAVPNPNGPRRPILTLPFCGATPPVL
ncbi:AFG3-like protein 1 [Platysternon megacephalum]|uniref:AFG3-like protein 1 n=1 Tax=Platysternon megacephalum TaxID=55544 RepID=A0A4D9E3M5_9SAUR|nr:AFG3-like protein 1 [Platysternon megacephalum]